MRTKSLLLTLIFIFCFAINIVKLPASNFNDESYAARSTTSVDATSSNTVSAQAASATITMRDIAYFLSEKSEHYPLSDEFIEKYQQTSGGYIDLAKKTGRVVDKQKHEPNQKWHFFDSWLYPSIEDGSLSWDEDAKSRVYTKLLCPELLLWIYEAAGVDPCKVKAAKDVAEQGRAAKTAVTTIAKNMRACVSWEDVANAIEEINVGPIVTLNPSKLSLNVGEEATITATVEPSDAAGVASWSITQGEDLISITPNGNQATVNAIAKGTAKIKVSYEENLSAECVVTVKEQGGNPSQTSAKYNLLGASTAQIKTTENALAAFKLVDEGDGIIVSVSQIEYIYGGGSGGSGDNRWSSTNMLKIGSGSNNGSITITLNAEVSRIIITGYVHGNKCEIRVGDSNSTDWTDDANDNKTTTHICSDMNVVSKEAIDGEEVSTIVIDFESTDSITIATINTTSTKYPLYITSIEFVCTDAAQ